MFELFVDHFNGEDKAENFAQLFKEIDLDRDGQLDYNEFVQAAINHQAMLNKENIWEMFKMFDMDNDGFISEEELKYIFKTGQSLNSSEQFVETL